jgi:HK97 family phage major capsid protein
LNSILAAAPARVLGNDCAWYVSQRGYGSVFARLAGLGGGLIGARGNPQYLGYPVRVSQALPQVTTSLNGKVMLAFGSLRASTLFGDRRGISVARSVLGPTFASDMVAIRVTERIDIVSHDLGGATTPGAVIGLVGTT